jgi:hypothetical protein
MKTRNWNGMEMECLHIPQAHVNQTRPIFFLQPLKVRRGNLWSSGSEAGQKALILSGYFT